MHNKSQQYAADGRRTPFPWLLRRHSKVAAVLSVMEIEKLRFSQRMGITEIRTALQVEDMTRELRNSLWNVLDRHVWQTSDFLYKVHGDGDIKAFSEVLWSDFFKLATDKRPEFPGAILELIRNYFFECEELLSNLVYDHQAAFLSD